MSKRSKAFLFSLIGMALLSLCGAVVFDDFSHIKRNGVEMLQPNYPYGQISAGVLNGRCFVDGLTSYKTLNSATNDPACSSVEVASLYTETLTANWAITRSNLPIVFDGACNIIMNGFSVTAPSTVNNVLILSPFTHSSNQAGSNLGCSFQGYTGTGAVFDIGDSSGFLNNVKITGINASLSAAGAGATGFRLTNFEQSDVDDVGCIEGPVSGQSCIRTIGTGALFAGLNRIMSIDCEASLGATNNFCIQLGTISNDFTIIGGHANILSSGANNSVCIDVSGANSGHNKVFGFDCDTGVTAVTVESTVSGAIVAYMSVDSGVTNAANFGAGSFGNVVYLDANLPFTDNGTAGTNSVINPARDNWRTDVWQMQQSASSMQWINVGDAAHLLFTNGAGSQTRINGGSGAGQILFAFDNGTGGFNFCKGTASVNSCTLWNPTTTAQRTLTSPDGNSSTVIPFSFTTTAATTDNVAVAGMTASGHCSLDATNSAAAAGLSSVFISAKTTNQITVTHTATAGWTFDGLCTSN